MGIGCEVFELQPNDLENVDPELGEWSDPGFLGGGHYLLEDTSPAIDHGNATALDDMGSPLLINVDQRGEPRPVDGNLSGQSIPDAGAIEFQIGGPVEDPPDAGGCRLASSTSNLSQLSLLLWVGLFIPLARLRLRQSISK